MRNLAWRGSRSLDPRQRRWIGAPHISSWPESLRGSMRAGNRHGLPSRCTRFCRRPAPAAPAPRKDLETSTVLARQLVSALRRWSSVASAAVLAVVLGGCGNTDSWVEAAPAQGWPAQYADAANSSYTATGGRHRAGAAAGRGRSRGARPPRPALSSRSYLAVNAQTPAGCSLMEWENDDNGRQRWCTRLCPGRRVRRPAVRRLRQPLRRPARARSCPSRRRSGSGGASPVIGMPTTPRILGRRSTAGQSRTWDRCWCSTPIAARWSATPVDLVDGVDPTDSTRGLADCAPARRAARSRPRPRSRQQTGMVVIGLWEPGAPRRVLVGLRYHPGPESAAHPGVDQRRRRRRRPGQPGDVRRRLHRLRQRPRPAAVGAACRRRQAEMVGAAGVPGADAARR